MLFFSKVWIRLSRRPLLLAFIGSICATLISLSTRGLVNSDGTVFLTYAELIRDGRLSDVLKMYPYPFFSCLIAFISLFIGGNVQLAADLLNCGFWALATVSFFGLLRVYAVSETAAWCGLLAFLFFPVINEIRSDIYRDPGFIALSLLSVWLLLRCWQEKRKAQLFAWGVAVLGASLFRIEALVFLLFPFILFILDRKGIWKQAMWAAILLLMCGCLIFLFYEVTSSRQLIFATRLNNAISGMEGSIALRVESVEKAVLNKHSDKHSLGFLLFGSIYLLIAPVVSNLQWFILYALLVSARRSLRKVDIRLWAAALLAVVPLGVQIFYAAFLQARYAILFSILLLSCAIVKFGDHLILPSRWGKIFSCLFLMALFVDGFIQTGPSREYKVDAVHWAQQNLDQDQTVLSNSRGVSYSIHHVLNFRDGMRDNPGCKVINKYDYYVHLTGKRGRALPACLSDRVLVKEFSNFDGHAAQIYKVR